MKELIQQVQQWANERGLNKPEQAKTQFLKVLSEYGETCDAIIKREKNGDDDIIDGFGDIIVTLIVLCNTNSIEFDPSESIYLKWRIEKNQLYFGSFLNQLNTIEYSLSYAPDDLQRSINMAAMELNSYIHDFGFTPEQCLAAAYSEIKDRKGVTVNGTFIKDEVQSVAAETANEKNNH